jgi:GT2 family glycosyltransferase
MVNKSAVLDIVIVNYNSSNLLLNCLNSFNGSFKTIPANIFIQDNNSTDDFDIIEQCFPNIQIQRNNANLGFSKANNKALSQGFAPYILLLNPDTQFINSRIKEVINYMEENPKIGIIGPKILNSDKTIQGSARSFPSFSTAFFGRNTILSRLFPNNLLTRKNILNFQGKGDKVLNVDWVSGACMLIRREALNEIGPLDERFFMYFEDTDLCKRMWIKNWKVVYHPKFNLLHHVGGSSSQNVYISVFNFHKSIYLYCYKYTNPRLFSIIKFFIIPLLITRASIILTIHLFKRMIGNLFRKLVHISP